MLPKCTEWVVCLLLVGCVAGGSTHSRGILQQRSQHTVPNVKQLLSNLNSTEEILNYVHTQSEKTASSEIVHQRQVVYNALDDTVINTVRKPSPEKKYNKMPSKDNKQIAHKNRGDKFGILGIIHPKSTKPPVDQNGKQRSVTPDTQSDDPKCRDDLCNVVDRTSDLSVTFPPKVDTGEFECPRGYRKVNRGGVDFCRPLAKTDPPHAFADTGLQCTDNQQLVKTQSGEICVPVKSVTMKKPVCPPGQGPLTVTDGNVQCFDLDPHYRSCPPDHQPIKTDKGTVCQAITRQLPVKISKSGKNGKRKIEIQKKRALKKKNNLISKITKGSRNSTHLVMPECDTGKVPAMSAEGFICLEPVFPASVCPENRVPHLTAHGLDCVPCPHGQMVVQTEEEITCVDMTTMSPISVTEEPCPEGLIPLQTSVGRVCQYVPPSVPQEAPDCPRGQTASAENGKVICVTDSQYCPQGQVTIETETGGMVCGFSVDVADGAGCAKGENFINGRCVNAREVVTDTGNDPCPPGLQLVTTGFDTSCIYANKVQPKRDINQCSPGFVMVQTRFGTTCMNSQKGGESYDNVRCRPGLELFTTDSGTVCLQTSKEGTVIGAKNRQQTKCAQGTIPTQTQTGFQCQPVDLPTDGEPLCEQGYILARIGEMYECISVYDADTVCKENQLMIKLSTGFICRRSGEVKHKQCNPTEVMVLDAHGQSKCISLEAASALCGEDYRAVREGQGFVCKRQRLALKCPEGFTLSLTEVTPTCVSLSDPECLNTNDGGCMGNIDTSNDRVVSPCDEGYMVEHSVEGQGCHLHIVEHVPAGPRSDVTEHVPAGPRSDVTGGLEPCDNINGGVRPCDLDIELLLAGCNPDCANGGTCNNGTCTCPPGITGSACQQDVDECSYLPAAVCEHKCENTWGSYHCTCPDGTMLNTDGTTCTATGCVPDCLNNGKCDRGMCRCPSGFEGKFCQTDKDECSLYGDRMCQHLCRNTYGGYQCVCPPGTRLNDDRRTCTNTTCVPGCRNGGSCENHRCHCPDGFYGIICQFDVNECNKHHPCQQTCHNTWGSYICTCRKGYALDVDQHSCI